jgi:hypothetical protein
MNFIKEKLTFQKRTKRNGSEPPPPPDQPTRAGSNPFSAPERTQSESSSSEEEASAPRQPPARSRAVAVSHADSPPALSKPKAVLITGSSSHTQQPSDANAPHTTVRQTTAPSPIAPTIAKPSTLAEKLKIVEAAVMADFKAADPTSDVRSKLAILEQPLTTQNESELEKLRSAVTAVGNTGVLKRDILQLISRSTYTNPITTGLKSKKTLDIFNTPEIFLNVKRLGDRFTLHPKLQDYLNNQKVGFVWLSNEAGHTGGGTTAGHGGAAVINNAVHLSPSVCTDPAFQQYTFHEIGHVSLQRWLTNDQTLPEDESKNPPRAKLSDLGKTFLDAWNVLRDPANKQYFFVPNDLGIGAKADRPDYLAGGFNEFCAESCMHMVLMPAELKTYVANLQQSNAPPAVKNAYASALTVLDQFERNFL